MSEAKYVSHTEKVRVALLDMTNQITVHAHSQYHLLFKVGGENTRFLVCDEMIPLSDEYGVGVNSWETHAYPHEKEVERSTILALYINPEYVEDTFGNSQRTGYNLSRSITLTPIIQSLVNELVLCTIRGESIGRGATEKTIEKLLSLCVQEDDRQKRCGTTAVSSDYRIRRSIQYMRDHIVERIDFQALASEVCLSRPHFFELFKESTNMTPGQYWNVLRMEYALNSLREPDNDITRISADLGFTAQGNFTRFFRSRQGVSPANYRKAVCEK